MIDQVEAILFDNGGTLRRKIKRGTNEKREIVCRLMALIGAQGSEEAFYSQLSRRSEAYYRWARQTQMELSESELWAKWMLPDYPSEQVRELAVQLNQLYRDAHSQKIVFPESREVILELFRRGYRLGLVSNTTSSIEVPGMLKEMEIGGCFETIVLSTAVGVRKPNPEILIDAANRMGVAPEKCVYIGDRIDRDVTAARRAKFSKVILMQDHRSPDREAGNDSSLTPDHVIQNLRQLLEYFPPRPTPHPETVYNASLSTMSAMNAFPTLPDFFEYARRLGFVGIELNHKITPAMLAGIDLNRYRISSIHEPCPAEISQEELKRRDWLISSADEACRREGVKAIKRSIELASHIRASTVIIHCGCSTSDKDEFENKLRWLLKSGKRESDEYRAILARMVEIRAKNAPPGFTSVRKSLVELLEYADPLGIRLGLENRYHYLEFPSPDELGILLDMAGPDKLGFIYDTGHTHVMSQVGFYPQAEWLRYESRIIGAHLHDVVDTADHFAPGLGEVDFAATATCLPDNAFRTCEIQTFNSPEQVKASIKFLADQGCIKPL